jgi:urease accessory protein
MTMSTTAANTGTTAPRTDSALLHLLWLASPALPVGGFSYSEGLEAAVEAGLVHDETSTGDWLAQQLQAALGRSDLAVVAAAVDAHRAGDTARIEQLDAWVRQTRETSELRLQSEQMGRSLGEWQRSLGAPAGSERTYPVAFAGAAAAGGASTREIALAFAFAWSENVVQSAVKAVPLGQGAGQRILARLAQAIPPALDRALALGDADRQAFTPMLAILSAQHETQYSRLFRS